MTTLTSTTGIRRTLPLTFTGAIRGDNEVEYPVSLRLSLRAARRIPTRADSLPSRVEHQNPVVLLSVRWREKLLNAFVRILANDLPRSIARTVPLSLHWRAVDLVHLNAHGLAARCVGHHKASVFGSCGHESIGAAAWVRRKHGLVGNHLVPRSLFE